MSQKQKRFVWSALLVIVVVLGALAFVAGRSRPAVPAAKKPAMPPRGSLVVQRESAKDAGPGPRNLSLQPEAFNLAHRLGQRFSAAKLEQSTLVGTLTIGSEQHNVQTSRTQTKEGEKVEITMAGSQKALTWDKDQGAFAAGSRAQGSDLDLLERLVFDSPDQFVLAQLRGASYYTVSRNVRPAKADDDYAGPLWNIVRVDDPQRDLEKKPQSVWRLYYINTRTGLIDRIVSQLRGETIEAEISGWTSLNGEKVPGQITWNSQGQTLMQYRLTTFSHGQK